MENFLITSLLFAGSNRLRGFHTWRRRCLPTWASIRQQQAAPETLLLRPSPSLLSCPGRRRYWDLALLNPRSKSFWIHLKRSARAIDPNGGRCWLLHTSSRKARMAFCVLTGSLALLDRIVQGNDCCSLVERKWINCYFRRSCQEKRKDWIRKWPLYVCFASAGWMSWTCNPG